MGNSLVIRGGTSLAKRSKALRAAQYIRMSTDYQRYSPQNQAAAIATFAQQQSLAIIRTYMDEGRSGLRIKGRKGLTELIKDVQSGHADFTRDAALAGMNLDRKLSAVFGCHDPLDVLDDARQKASVVVELLGTIDDLDATLFAEKLVISAFIDVLEATPSADVIDQDVVIGISRWRTARFWSSPRIA